MTSTHHNVNVNVDVDVQVERTSCGVCGAFSPDPTPEQLRRAAFNAVAQTTIDGPWSVTITPSTIDFGNEYELPGWSEDEIEGGDSCLVCNVCTAAKITAYNNRRAIYGKPPLVHP